MRGAPRRSLRYGQLRTILLLFGGYAACYYCRADLSVATPLLVEELGKQGLSHSEAIVRIGSISSWSSRLRAGQTVSHRPGGLLGRRRNFLIGVGGAAVFTLLFAAGGTIPMFTLAWLGNRLTPVARLGRPHQGLLQVVRLFLLWVDHRHSQHQLPGRRCRRAAADGMLIERGYGWRALFLFAAIVAGVMLIASLLWLRESRAELDTRRQSRTRSTCLRRRVAACQCRRAAAGAVAQPGVSPGLSAVVHLHDSARDVQYLDTRFTCAITSDTA